MFIFKNIFFFRVIILLVLAAFTGCVTSKIEYTESNELPKDKVYRISDVYMKDGTVINLKGKDAKFKLKHKGVENVIVYIDDKDKEILIPVKDVNNIMIEVLEGHTLLTVLTIVGVLILAFFIILLIAPPFKGSITG
ncbi:MAG: hypothetical protein HOP31_06275 [Ignavibacteria bacterium]|nr:hypothetical protein [Ignavibacteria bacterium]